MNNISQLMNEGYYSLVYEKLLSINEDLAQETYTLAFFCGEHLKNVDAEKKFAYLNYVLARKESAEMHIFICNYLLYGDGFFDDIHTVVNWHFRRALEISNNSPAVLREIISNYKDHPDSPFTEEEMVSFETLLKTTGLRNVCNEGFI